MSSKPKTTRMLLVRHGSTVLTAEDRFAGETDVALGEDGAVQASLLAKRLANAKITAVYASPMQRTMRTASIIAEPHGLPVQPFDGLREMSHGAWEGKTRAEVELAFADEYAQWQEDPFTFAPRGGEAGLQVLARALPVIRDVVSRHPGETILVVSHKATIRLVIGSLLGFDLRRYRDNLDQSPCCLNIVDFSKQKTLQSRLTLFNDTSHYSDALEPTNESRLSKFWCAEQADAALVDADDATL
eukprot:TRINITY_DN20087_c0_g1_i1.p1 TRINITY_DN20087_c0_g1~~TRINITY_DN20087_c0_g1_i1.p1  ORF type:complete len:244 (-),score=68.38 TRINITY_DN20087_c0_g1_i1:145-876(-)